MTTTEITVYEQHEKTYCEGCKPQGGTRNTLVISSYDHFCAGCGRDFLELVRLSPDDMSVRPICGHPYFTKLTPGMSAEDITFLKSGFCPECAEREEMCEQEYQLQQAWDVLQAVPAYTEQYQRYHTGLSAFFQVVALLASQEIDPLSLDWEEANLWRELQDAWELVGDR